jgi:hypothetical protein
MPGEGRKSACRQDSTFAKEDLAKKYEWWNTPRGSIEKVVSPWTPVTLKQRTVGVWGREMEIGAAGLPTRVSTQGREILAAPGRLVATLADGKETEAQGVKTKTRFDQKHRKIVEVESKLGDIAVSSEVRAEFDGMYKVTMTLTPKRPVDGQGAEDRPAVCGGDGRVYPRGHGRDPQRLLVWLHAAG